MRVRHRRRCSRRHRNSSDVSQRSGTPQTEPTKQPTKQPINRLTRRASALTSLKWSSFWAKYRQEQLSELGRAGVSETELSLLVTSERRWTTRPPTPLPGILGARGNCPAPVLPASTHPTVSPAATRPSPVNIVQSITHNAMGVMKVLAILWCSSFVPFSQWCIPVACVCGQ